MATQTGSIDLRGVKQSYEGVEIGGRNLLRNSGTYDGWLKNDGVTSDGNILDINVSGATSNLFRKAVGSLTKTFNELNGETCGVSFEVYCDDWSAVEAGTGTVGARAVQMSLVTFNATNDMPVTGYTLCRYRYGHLTDDTLWNQPASYANGEWIKITSKPFSVPEVFTGIDVSTEYGTYVGVTPQLRRNGHVKFRNIKWEIGNKATDWTPAPEDVQEGIDTAKTAADDAQSTANTAQTTANDAQNAAVNAQTSADNAAMSASEAAESANNAQTAADEAKSSISNIEYIVGASSWVTEHGIYNKSTDTTVDATKDYYTVSATAVSNPTGSPHKGLYYERSNNVYTLTSDDIVVSGKTYYTLAATLVGSPTGNPSTNGYYEQRLNESIEDYLSAHIRTNSDGLFVTDGSDSQVQINSTGVSIWNGEEQIASYGSVAQIGALSKFHILIGGNENEIGFYFGDSKMAYLNGDELYVQNSLSFGNEPFATFTFYQRANGHFTLKLVNPE